MISNCLFFVYERWRAHGGYVVVMHSLHGWWPHFAWTPDLRRFEEFAPAQKTDRLFPPLVFNGSIQKWVLADGPEVRPYTHPKPGKYCGDRRIFTIIPWWTPKP
jgi:hypothetical protein